MNHVTYNEIKKAVVLLGLVLHAYWIEAVVLIDTTSAGKEFQQVAVLGKKEFRNCVEWQLYGVIDRVLSALLL